MQAQDSVTLSAKWLITRYKSEAAYAAHCPTPVMDPNGVLLPAFSVFSPNLLLNEGITALQNLLIGGAETAFSNAAAYLGVGDDNTAAAAGQTGLQASTNKLYAAMETSYPAIASQTTTWRSVFGSGDANFAWAEFTVANGGSDASDNLNRKVSDQGTKASGQVWTLDLTITFS